MSGMMAFIPAISFHVGTSKVVFKSRNWYMIIAAVYRPRGPVGARWRILLLAGSASSFSLTHCCRCNLVGRRSFPIHINIRQRRAKQPNDGGEEPCDT